MALTDDMIAMLSAGVAHQVGGCTNAGRPVQLVNNGRLIKELFA